MIQLRFSLLIGFLCAVITAWAQPEEYSSARRNLMEYRSTQNVAPLNRARDQIDRAIEHESTQDRPKTWLLRGEIYLCLFIADVENKKLKYKALDIGTKTRAALSEADDSLLATAGISLLKCLDLDTGQEHLEAERNLTGQIVSLSQSAGVAKYGSQQFEQATGCFYRAFVLEQKIGIYDSLALFNSALCALKSGQYAQAVQWSRELVAGGYNPEGSRWILSQCYLESGDFLRADSIIQQGLRRNPESGILRIQLIEQRLLAGDTSAADSIVRKINKIQGIPGANDAVALADYYRFLIVDPDDAGQRAGKRVAEKQLIQRAEYWYAYALKIQPAFFDARYNLGTLYYNLGVRERKNAEANPGPAVRQIWQGWFLKAARELEFALEIRKKDIAVLNALKTVYTQLGDTENYERVKGMEK